MAELLDFGALRRNNTLPSIVGAFVKLHRVGHEWKTCCPFHEDRSPSFTIFSGGERFHCFGCGATGDVLDFIQRAHGVGLREAADMLSGGMVPSVRPSQPAAGSKCGTDAAKRIWRNAARIDGTPAQAYLRNRGINLGPLPPFRFAILRHSEGGVHPCLVALVTSLENGIAGIQRTYVTEDGRKAAVKDKKLSLGRVAGCAIRLGPAAAELIVTEGAEDGLSLLQELGAPVWVAAGASMLPRMRFPPIVRSIVIGADGDVAGEKAARKAAEEFSARGLAVRIMRPAAGFKDFNQELAAGTAGRSVI